jgi:hypothetical protein
MATAFVTIAQAAVDGAAEPGLPEDEFAFYIEDLEGQRRVVLIWKAMTARPSRRRSGSA